MAWACSMADTGVQRGACWPLLSPILTVPLLRVKRKTCSALYDLPKLITSAYLSFLTYKIGLINCPYSWVVRDKCGGGVRLMSCRKVLIRCWLCSHDHVYWRAVAEGTFGLCACSRGERYKYPIAAATERPIPVETVGDRKRALRCGRRRKWVLHLPRPHVCRSLCCICLADYNSFLHSCLSPNLTKLPS